jgi:hypothetical protein
LLSSVSAMIGLMPSLAKAKLQMEVSSAMKVRKRWQAFIRGLPAR